MSNSHGSPHCVYCKTYIDNKNRRCCLKHNFILPKIGYSALCKDYRYNVDNSAFDMTEGFDINALYYYYGDQYEKLDIFENIQQLILGAWIKK